MAATVEGVFRILDRASPALDKIHAKAQRLDKKLNETGRTMDRFAAKGSADIKTLDKDMSDLASRTDRTTGRMNAGMEAMARGVGRATSMANRDIEQLQAHLGVLDATRASPTVELDGVATSMAQIKMLRNELRKLGEEQVRIQASVSEVAVSGRGAARRATSTAAPQRPGMMRRMARWAYGEAMTGATGAPTARGAATSWFGRKIRNRAQAARERVTGGGDSDVIDETTDALRRASQAGGLWSRVARTMAYRAATLTALFITLAPVLEAFAGALGALVGVASGATGAAAAGAGGLLGAGIVGFGGMYAASKPLFTQIGLLNDAFTSYNETVRQFGERSQEARDAQKELQIAMRQSETMGGLRPERVMGLLESKERFGQRWRRLTRPGQRETIGWMENAMARGQQNAPFLAGVANQGASGVNNFMNQFMDRLDTPMFRDAIGALADLFESRSGAFGRAMGNMTRMLANLAVAAKPLVIDFIKWLDKWMRGAAQDTSNTDKWSRRFKDWQKDLKAVVGLLKETGLWLAAFFGAGRDPGRGLVRDITKEIRESRKDIQADNGQGLESWYQRMVNNTKDIVRELAAITRQLGEMVDAISRLIGPITDVMEALRPFGDGWLGSLANFAVGGGAIYGATKLGKAGVRALGRRLPWGKGGAAASTAAGGVVEEGAERAAKRAGLIGAGGALRSLGGKLGSAAGLSKVLRFGGPAAAAAAAADFLLDPGDLSIPDPDTAAASVLREQLAAARRKHGPNWWRKDAIVRKVMSGPLRGVGKDTRGFMGASGGDLFNVQSEVQEGLAATVGQRRQVYGMPQLGAKEAAALNNRFRRDAEGLKEVAQASRRARQAMDRLVPTFRDAREGADKLRPALRGVARSLGAIDRGFGRMTGGILAKLAGMVTMGAAILVGGGAIWNRIIDNTFDSVDKRVDKTAEGVAEKWDWLKDHMKDDNKAMLQDTRQTFGAIMDELRADLRSLGYSGGELNRVMQGQDVGSGGASTGGGRGGGRRGSSGAAGRTRAARGGVVPGTDLRDTVAIGPGMLAAGGERVINQHTMRRIDARLRPFGTNVDREIGREHRTHNFPGPSKERFAARGGIVPLGRQLQKQGFQVGEHPAFGGVAGVHAPGSYHYSGQALDVNYDQGNETAALTRLYNRLKNMPGIIELLWQVPDHYDHLHLAMGSGGGVSRLAGLGMGGMPAPKLQGRRGFGGAGSARRAASQGAIDALIRGGQRRLGGAAGGMGGANFGNVATGPVQQMAREMVMQMWGPGQWGPFNALEMAEAGWNPRAVNASSGAAGLAQALPPSKYPPGAWPYTGPKSAKLQLEWMMGYIKDRYGSPSEAWRFHQANNWYTRGGTVPNFAGWFKRGGTFDTHGPTGFIAGEDGSERVTITPKGQQQQSGGGRNISVRIDKIENHRPGDIAKMIEKEIRDFAYAVEGAGQEDPDGVME